MIIANFSTKDNILFVHSSGNITLDDMILVAQQNLNNDKLPRNLSIIEDATEAIANFTFDDLKLLNQNNDKLVSMYTSIKHAVIQSNSVNIALSVLYETYNSYSNYMFKVFFSEAEARKWLTN